MVVKEEANTLELVVAIGNQKVFRRSLILIIDDVFTFHCCLVSTKTSIESAWLEK